MSASGPKLPTTSSDAPFDVCVVGGGPAGATLALRLSELGRSVAIAEKAVFPRPHIGEALTFGALPLLSALGLRETIESAGFLASEQATVDWAGELRRYPPHGGPGVLVDRARFDALLLNTASKKPGVRLYQPARVVRVRRAGDQWIITLHTGETLRARYLAEASGRTRILRRSRRRLGAPTIALYAYFQGAYDRDAGETFVEAGPSAWYWGSPIPGGEFNATVFVDPGPSAGYDGLVRESKLLWPLLRGARRPCEARICDATAYVDKEPISSTFIKVGDAALALDPLSSQGVQTAIGTALHAAVVLNTMMDRPEDTELAIDFYRSRIHGSGDFHAAAAADFYRRQAAFSGGDFWEKRASLHEPEPNRGALAPDRRIMLAPQLTFAPVAIAGETRLLRQDGVKLSGKRYALVGNGIPIAPMLREIGRPMLAMEVVRRWSRSMHATQALKVLQWAWAEGLVCPHDAD